MKARNITVASTTIALGAVAWVVLSNRHTEQDQRSRVVESMGSAQQATLPAPAIPSPDLADTNPGSPEEGKPPSMNTSQPTVIWPKYVLKFADQPDSAPLLSREIEYQIQKSIDINIDARKFEVQPIMCRGAICQILARPKEPNAENSAWGPVLATMLKDLTDTPVLNPATGMKLGAPYLRAMVEPKEGGIVTGIEFKKPTAN